LETVAAALNAVSAKARHQDAHRAARPLVRAAHDLLPG
jgi:hypothetical protein